MTPLTPEHRKVVLKNHLVDLAIQMSTYENPEGSHAGKAAESIQSLITENRVLREALEGSQKSSQEARIKELEEALRPFAHPDLGEILGGNVQGNESIVFQKNKAFLKIGDFRKAAALHPSAASTAAQEPKIGD